MSGFLFGLFIGLLLGCTVLRKFWRHRLLRSVRQVLPVSGGPLALYNSGTRHEKWGPSFPLSGDDELDTIVQNTMKENWKPRLQAMEPADGRKRGE